MEYIKYCVECGKPKVYKNKHSYIYSSKPLCKSCSKTKQNNKLYPNKLEKLLLNTPESYYWIGYLLADGHFQNNRIIFSQNGEDKISVENFVKYIEGTTKIKYTNNIDEDKAKFWISSKTIIPKITEKFNINPNKTYCPPDVKIFEDMDIDLLAYLFIGFVDGDGCIQKNIKNEGVKIHILIHSSWLDILKIFEKRLFELTGYSKIDKDGYARLIITRSDLLRKFKRKYFNDIDFEPLHRKWDKIDINYISKSEMSFNQIKKLYNLGYKPKEICKELNYTLEKVYYHIKKIKMMS